MRDLELVKKGRLKSTARDLLKYTHKADFKKHNEWSVTCISYTVIFWVCLLTRQAIG